MRGHYKKGASYVYVVSEEFPDDHARRSLVGGNYAGDL